MPVLRLAALALTLLSPLAAHAAAPPEIFALIVTNNRSLESARPDLHYADDDGVRFLQLMRMVAPQQNVTLLTELDRASARLYPELARAQQPPSKKNVQAAARALAARIAARKKQGIETVFYFVFAGHGDVSQGQGYLELTDGRFGAKELEQIILEQVKADRVHLILDSCNSFFMVSPRKPGGRRWATPKDLTRGFAARYPHVGVFLSTSAEGEVYEWSALQAGIFSHEVRSGLTGAADVDRDGSISYSELMSFVAVANKRVKNEHYRPRVFSRGPQNDAKAELFSLRGANGRKLLLGKAPLRLWIRDHEGNRVVDVNKEAGAPMALVLPTAADGRFWVQVQTLRDGKRAISQYALGSTTTSAPAATPSPAPAGTAPATTVGAEPIRLAALTPTPLTMRARGHEVIFEQIFAAPFGPRAHAQMLVELDERPTAIFGISRRDSLRMRHYLAELARADRSQRQLTGWIGVFMGVAIGGATIGLASIDASRAPNSSIDPKTMTWVMGGVSAALGTFGLYQLLRLSEGEKALASFDSALHAPHATREAIVARTESHLMALAERDARQRRFASIFAFVMSGLMAVGEIAMAFAHAQGEDIPAALHVTMISSAVGVFGLGLLVDQVRTPSERILNLYRTDPDLVDVGVSVGPVYGGAALSLSGRF